MKNKKTKTKNYYSTNNEKLQEKSREYHKNLSEDEKIKKKIKNKKRKYAKNRRKNNSDEVRGRKREYMRNYYHKKCVKSFN